MIIATASRSGTITATGEMLVSGAKLKISLSSIGTTSIGGLNIKTSETQLRGPPGSTDVEVSGDPDNRLAFGTDEKLLVPEITTDLLALYILARS